MSIINTTSNKKEFYRVEIKAILLVGKSKRLINRLKWQAITSQTFDHNTDGINAAFELIGNAKVESDGEHFSALIISSRDDVVYDQEFNVPLLETL